MNKTRLRCRVVLALSLCALLVFPTIGGAAPKPLAVSVTVTSSEAIVAIAGGKPRFTVSSVQANSVTQVYSGKSRTVSVPLVDGILIFEVTDQTGSTVRSTPVAVGVELWTAEPASGRIAKFSSDAATTTARTTVAFSGLRNIAVRPADGHLFAVDQTVNLVIEFDESGGEVRQFAVPNAYRAQDVTFDPVGHIYVVDRTAPAGRVCRFDSAGNLEAEAPIVAPTDVSLPAYGNTMMHIIYHEPTAALLVRFNSGAVVGLDPDTLSTKWYRYSSDPLLVPGWDMDPARDVLYSGAHGGADWGRQSDFVLGVNHLYPLVGTGVEFYAWTVPALQPQVLDISVDSQGFVYVLQADGGGTMGVPVQGARVHVYDGAGGYLMSFDVDGALRLGVVR